MESGLPSVLVLGATGFVGRHFVNYLITNNLANVTAVDKQLPNCAYLSAEEEQSFEKANYTQKNLVNPAAIASLWDGKEYDFVVNLAAETKYGHTDDVYKERVHHLSIAIATEAAKHNVRRFIEASTAQVYDPSSNKAKNESGKLDPWTNIAKFKLQVEQDLKGIGHLNYVVVRPAIIYGPGDRTGIAPRIICGAIYKHLNKPMKLLWNADLRINTVHVHDVARALWHLTTHGDNGAVYNLADKTDTDQGKVNKALEELFGIKTKFAGKALSSVASNFGMDKVTSMVNDKHVAPWSTMTKEKEITITPLSPYLDKELLGNTHLAVDGSAIEATGFKYEVPEFGVERLREWVDYYTKLRLFPDGYLA